MLLSPGNSGGAPKSFFSKTSLFASGSRVGKRSFGTSLGSSQNGRATCGEPRVAVKAEHGVLLGQGTATAFEAPYVAGAISIPAAATSTTGGVRLGTSDTGGTSNTGGAVR